ncbi:hypothetical protein F5050DRAFT_1811070 [Lentinula boryana]|uniref:Uncharacterized protein n=1 Tax=Lentinula boryana TaxID=40481 RepID=A0ABQ8Q2N5_9AGAR|nr:hypothetical protein F5050DRAFT_1811070 [Lentinula boryana]
MLASASALQSQQARVPIVLPKHSTLSKSDGTFDLDKAIAQTVATQNKHRQNLINLQNNTGSLPQASLDKRQAEALTDEEDDEENGIHWDPQILHAVQLSLLWASFLVAWR